MNPEVGNDLKEPHFYALDGRGAPRWKFETKDKIRSSPVAADLDGDGRPEVLVGSNDNHLYVLSGDSALRSKFRTKKGSCTGTSKV